MHLALVCFFSEADARKLAKDAGREASKSYTVKRTGESKLYTEADRIRLGAGWKLIAKGAGRAYENARNKTLREAIQKGEREATHFSIVEFYGCFLVLNILAFYGCLKYLLASMLLCVFSLRPMLRNLERKQAAKQAGYTERTLMPLPLQSVIGNQHSKLHCSAFEIRWIPQK